MKSPNFFQRIDLFTHSTPISAFVSILIYAFILWQSLVQLELMFLYELDSISVNETHMNRKEPLVLSEQGYLPIYSFLKKEK
jgi:hypothetical protein